jgi:DNA-binding transcriptional regulator YiaG
MKIVKEGTVVKVEKGRPPRVHIRFDDGTVGVYLTSPAVQWKVGARVPIQLETTARPVAKQGRPLILTDDVIRKAIKRLGSGVTQAEAARELGVTPNALRAWAARKNLHSWDEVKRLVGVTRAA